MNVVVTGSGGFLGKELVKQLLYRGYDVVALTSQDSVLYQLYGNSGKLKVISNQSIIDGSYSFNKDDILINCAFPRTNNHEQVADGLDYVQKTIKQSVFHGASIIINISSQSVYGENRDYVVDENSNIILDSVYATGKYASELLTKMYDDIDITNIRLGSLIGQNFNQRVVNKMIDYALKNDSLKYGISKKVFSYLDVEDACRGLTNLIETPPNKWKNVYNLGGDYSYTIEEIAITIAEAIYETKGKRIKLYPYISDDVGNMGIDNNSIKEIIGEYQFNTLKDSVFKIINSY